MSSDEQPTLPMSPDDQPTVASARPNGSRPSSSGMWQAPEVEELQALLPQYEILDILGRGGMGAVYKAQQKSLNRLVAIKILPLDAADNEMQFIERFRNEAQTMAKMNHPAIVSVYDFGEAPGGLLYFIMEFVDGTDVQKMIRTNRLLSGEYALAITAHVCDALDYAHSRGVIHRDIKPANILIDQEGHVKVADFGLAKMHDPSQTSGLTRTNMAMGTPDYIAPEVISFDLVADHRADIYAVGVMLYQMLTGEVPRGMFKMPSDKGIDSDPRFDEIISKAMEPDREERYQSAMDVRLALDVILTTAQPKDDGTGAVPAQEIPTGPRRMVTRGSSPTAQSGAGRLTSPGRPAGAPVNRVQAKKPATPWLGIVGIAATVIIAAGLVFLFVGGDKPGTGGVVIPKPKDSTVGNSALPARQDPARIVADPPKQAAPLPADGWEPLFTEGEWRMTDGTNREFKDGLMHVLGSAQKPQSSPDGAIRARVQIRADSTSCAVVVRSGSTGHYKLSIIDSNQSVALNFFDGKFLSLGTYKLPAPLKSGETVMLELRVQGNQLTASVNGAPVIEAVDDHLEEPGFWGAMANPGWFESVEVQTLGPSTAPATITSEPTSATGRTIDLLALVDVKRDGLVGEWTRTTDAVSIARPEGAAVLQLPYQVPEEYDFEIEFTPNDAGANVNQYLSAAGHSFAWKLNAHSRTPPLYGLDLLDGKLCSQFDEAAVQTSTAIEPGHRYRSTVEVRRDGLRALLDGKELLKWSGDFKRLSMEEIMRLRDDQHLGIGSWKRAVTFHKIEIREITGTGKVEGGAVSAATEDLFDGRTFTGWKTTDGAPPETNWRVDAGVLMSSTRSVLRTIEEFGDCELNFEWRAGPGGNAGVFYHVVGDPLDAPEMQLCDPAFSGNTPSGGLFAVIQPQSDASKPIGEWNTARLVISGSRREHWINGQKVCAYDVASADYRASLDASKFAGKPQFGTGSRGALALQNNGGEIAYRNLRIRRP